MNISNLVQKWSNINAPSKIVIITDEVQKEFALEIKNEGIYNVRVEYFSQSNEFSELLKSLSELKESDLLIVMLSLDTFVEHGANQYFSPFDKPEGIKAKYIFVRLGISKESLIQGL